MQKKSDLLRLATDIGGTFTDIVLEKGAQRWTSKVLTTYAAPELAVLDGTRDVLRGAGFSFADIGLFVHGTTLATNALIERKGARTALVTTQGFRDVIAIADEGRFDQYDIFLVKPEPIVERALRFTVPERVDVQGQVRLALDEEAVALVAKALVAAGIQSVAICFMHAYVNPAHEMRTRDIIRRVAPDMAITLSSDVCPEAREYERSITAICNAYVQPLMAGYLGRLKESFAREGYLAPIHLMTSGGHLTSLETAQQHPIRLVESGPAGGAILAARIAAERALPGIVSFDMGGTTAKLCLIENATPFKARAFEIDRQSRFRKGSGMPVRIPVIEMVEIGAGGGSIASVDAMQRIMVGPHSAGSEPGPAAYGRGGTHPTVTDADVALGKIDPARFAGGRIPIFMEHAVTAIETRVAHPLRLSTDDAAYGIAEIVDENMANAARVHAVERGVSVTERTLVAFGGAAPLHASRLAEKLGINSVLVPADAGVGSAVGFLRAPAAYELVRSRFMRLDQFDAEAATALIAAMAAEARGNVEKAAHGTDVVEERQAFMRYAGQGHEIAVALPLRALVPGDAAALRAAFETEYQRLFARFIPHSIIEIMSWSVLVSTRPDTPQPIGPVQKSPAPQAIGTRDVFDTGAGQRNSVPCYARDMMQPGAELPGPCLIIEAGTSTYVSARFDVSVDAGHALILTRKAGA
ncbi:MAG: hydantoinase/oxoprolinase family protein [Beijerinckiaceae bacterium]